MQVRKKLTEIEGLVAIIVGTGLGLIILAFLLSSAGSGKGYGLTLNVFLGFGFLFFVGGSIGWVLATQPWKNFDSWATPLYLGPDASHGGHDAAHSAPHAEPHAVTHLEAEPIAHAAVAAPPAGTLQPAPITHLDVEPLQKVAPDNLTAIDGIGPKTVTALNNAGIKTLADLVARTPEDIEKIVRDSGVRMSGRATNWINQAKTIMANQSQP